MSSAPRGIRLDGRLDDPAWEAADSVELTQVEPHERAASTGRTVVRVLATPEAIIVGIRAADPEPGRIVAFARQRDASLSDEDNVKIVLDTYGDGRSGYVFAVNPNGARYDALVSDRGESENENWDAIWEAAAARTPTGWSTEIEIPIKSLMFRHGLPAWGFNVERRIQRLQETDRWAGAVQDAEVTSMGRSGLLTDVPPFDLGLGLTVRPAVVFGGGVAAPGAGWRSHDEASLDATQRIGANTLASLTVNTDFAETEVDTRQTNLTRFPLFFPEKRTFFLQGADIFDFGLGLSEDVVPFFSRRIGLLNGRQIPIDVGGKVDGRIGGTNFGALVVRTERTDTLPTGSTMGVVRVKQNVLRESSIGMIATFGDPLGRGNAWLAGPDLTYQTSHLFGDKNFLAGVWGLAMDRQGLAGDRSAWGGKLDYPNDLWDIAATYKRLGDAFQPSLGFVPRPGVQIATLSIDYQPRPSHPIGPLHVRQMFHEFEAAYVAGLDGGWQSYEVFMAPVNWRLESGDRFEFNAVPTGERLGEPFEIANGVTIPTGSYHWNRFRLEGELASKRRFSGQLTWWFGGFYTGKLDELELSAIWNASALVIVELTGTRNVGRLREGRFTQDLVGTRLRLNVSPDLQLNSFVQYDNESHEVGTNTRLRWTFVPAGDLFLVYNHIVRTADPITGARRWAFESNQLLVKLQYALRY
ncbi:MAG TPA: DUF5916 domain-containing protein [Gemmatimonadaceae bacterium]|nr:DUF5916 domain-containing protein [Gemmatimonadaceae bacterium]